MALNYTSFQSFPLQIVRITSEYNAKITAIETFVKSDMAYTGADSDVEAILPYFVYWFLCDDWKTTVAVEAGENSQVKEFSTPEIFKQVTAWNMGVDKLRAVFGITDDVLNSLSSRMTLSEKIHYLVLSSGKIVNENYLSKRSLI